MPEIIFKADQGAGVRKIIRIMQGDKRSHVIRFVVPRYDSGVDLSLLVWYIKLVGVDGTSNVGLPSALYEVTDEDIRVRWTVEGVSAAEVGSVKFQLYGSGKDAEGHVISWTGGAGEIEVTENIGFEVTEDQEEQLDSLDELIVFVQGELDDVIKAGNDAAAAAVRAEAAADGAVDATAAANRANAAAERAEFAAEIAEVKANALAASATGNPAQFYPDEHSIIKPVLTFEPTQEGKWNPCPAGGGKNLLQNTYGSKTANGITFTVNDDGSVTVNGTATAQVNCAINAYDPLIEAVSGKTVILSGCPAGGSDSTYRLGFYNYDGSEKSKYDRGSGSDAFTVNLEKGAICNVAIVIASGCTCNNLTFYPMLRLATVADATYQPWENIRPITGRTGTELVRCRKNLISSDKLTIQNKNIRAYYNDEVGFLLEAGATYTLTLGDTPADAVYVTRLDRSGGDGDIAKVYTKTSVTFKPSEDVRVDFNAYWANGRPDDAYMMLELGSESTAYEPYQGETFVLDFGTNLLKNTATTQTVNGITYTVNADGSVRANGTATANAYFYIDAAADSFEVGKEYKISGCPAGGSTSSYRVLFQYVNASGAVTFPANDMGSGGRFTCGEALKTPQYVIVVASGATVSNLTFHPAIYDTEEATVYGCTLNWNKGEMAVEMGHAAFDGTEPFANGGNVYFLNASYVPGIELGFLNENPNAKAYCSHFTQGAGGINDAAAVGKFDLGGSIRFNKSGFTTVDDFKAYLAEQYAADTPVQIVYKLAEPITVQLNPQQITALAGLNTLYGDADEMTVQYNKSLNAAFEELKNAILAMGGNV